jgi:hypothetical protein
MGKVRNLLESERRLEREFVGFDRADPKGWSAAMTLFHLCQWRQRMHNALSELRDGQPVTPPPPEEQMDPFNDAEMAGAGEVSLADSAARAAQLMASLIEDFEVLGERPFHWYVASTTTEAILRNSYTHPQVHIAQYLVENGEATRAYRLLEYSAAELRDAKAPPIVLATGVYNLACARVAQGRRADALTLLEEVVAMRPQVKEAAANDPDLAPLLNDPRFQAIIAR